MRFASPEYLYLLLIIPFIIGIYIFFSTQKKKNKAQLGETELLRQMMPGYSEWRLQLKFYLIVVALLVAVLLLARPQFGVKSATKKTQGVEVMVALDVSNSMLAQDITPNRLQVAKNILNSLSNDPHVGKMGIVVFAGEAYMQLPLTSDLSSAKIFQTMISPSLIPTQGTAIGTAIDKSVKSFSDKDVKAGRIILVITDGENHEDDAVSAAKTSMKADIPVSVIGIGNVNGSPIPDSHGGYKKDRSGETVLTKLNEEMCKEIATAGAGTYIHATNANDAITQVRKYIDSIATGEIEEKVYSEYDDRFGWFAAFALLLLVGEIFIFEKRRKRKG